MERIFPADCAETVSILYAIIFGTNGACISISTASILTAFAGFMVLVVIAQYFARRLWARLTTPRLPPDPDETSSALADDPRYDGGPIRTYGRRR